MLTLYNTLTCKKEEFKPLRGKEVRLYSCGPTVYDYAHIGNLRAYVFADVLRRALEYSGYAVKQVINITDIGHLSSDADEGEDKMVKALKREGMPLTLEAMKEVADKYTAAFFDDLKALNIEIPHETPRASAHIKEDIELIQTLELKGFAYKTSDGIYFDTSKFPAYGTRGGFKLGELKEGARVAVNAEKKDPRDFALWKFSKPMRTDADQTQNYTERGIGWESPWGAGFPGWHTECSAISRKYLGQPFDIHTGGIDHIPVHHQNEIAQSEAAYDTPLAHFWMHNEYLNMGSEKMAKSGENFITLRTLKERGFHPLAYRYYLLGAHYRSPIQFSWNALKGAQNSYFKLLLLFSSDVPTPSPILPDKAILPSVSIDLDTPGILATVWELVKEKRREEILDADRVLGLDIENQARLLKTEVESVPDEIKKLAATREDARRQKNFAKSDALREQIRAAGFEVMDTDAGPIIRKVVR